MAEDIRIFKDGVGQREGESFTSAKNKGWFPFTPDHYKSYNITGDHKADVLPGGTSLGNNQTTSHSIDPNLYGAFYDGHKNSNHIHHKYTIFAGNDPYGIYGPNLYNQSDAQVAASNRQIMGGLLITGKGYKNTNVCANTWSVYADADTGAGCPLPVYGITIDVTACGKSAGTVSSAGTIVKADASSYNKTVDMQINTVYGHWLNLDTGLYSDKKLLPNGDNWGGKAYANTKKYIFRNSQDFTDGRGQQLLGSDSQFRHTMVDSTGGDHKRWTMKLFLADNDKPPANSIFVGFSMQMCYGHVANTDTTRAYLVSNMGIITKEARDIMKDKEKYHGQNASSDDLPYIVLPKLVNARAGALPSSMPLYGPMVNW